MHSAPLVTIGISCFNAQDTIERALRSAISQNLRNKEIIVVDDASTDKSVSIIERFSIQNAGVRLIKHEKNLGVAASRNTILRAATGEFLAFFDDDDESFPTRLETQIERIRRFSAQYPDVPVVCYGSGDRQYPNGYNKQLDAIGAKEGTEPQGSEMVDFLLWYRRVDGRDYGYGVPACSLMAPRILLSAAGGFDESFRRVEDVELAIRLGLKGAAFAGTTEPVFRQYATVGSDKAPEANCAAEILLATKFKSYLDERGQFYYAKNWPLLRYYHFKKKYFLFFFLFFKITLRYPLQAPLHLMDTGPKRLRHEASMRSNKDSQS